MLGGGGARLQNEESYDSYRGPGSLCDSRKDVCRQTLEWTMHKKP